MRLLTRRIHRAFPELDRYSDEQCTRFVRAARRAFWPRVGRLTVRAIGYLLWCGLIVGAIWAIGQYSVFENAFMFGGIGRMLLAVAVTALAFGIIPGLGWFLWRDVQLRRRIRKILRARATCPGCGYRLVGLFVSPDHKVTCPECAMETEVDPSLGELATDESGRATFKPSAAPKTWFQRLPSRARRNLRRAAIAGVVLLVAGAPVGWVGYEFFLRHQAAVASRERPGVAGLEALVEKFQPIKEGEGVPDAWLLFEQAVSLANSTDSKVWAGGWAKTSTGREANPDFSMVFSEVASNANDEDRETYLLSRAAAISNLEAYEKAGLFDVLDAAAAARRAVRPIGIAPGQPLIWVLLPSLGKSRQLARACAARMTLAELRGDRDVCMKSFEELLMLSRITSHQPFIVDRLVSVAIGSLANARAQALLATHPPDDWLDSLDSAMARQGTMAPAQIMADGDRTSILDTISWCFSDPDKVRWGRFSKGLNMGAMAAGSIGPVRSPLGTYWANRDAANQQADWLKAAIGKERFERSTGPMPASSLILLEQLTPGYERSLQSLDQFELDRRGLYASIALERYRNKNGEYPATLDRLVPEQLAKLPIDPWSGKPLGYKRLDKPDELGRGYLLYSVGIDGKDDGGTAAANRYQALNTLGAIPAVKGASGVDFVINEPSPRPPLKDLQPLSALPKAPPATQSGSEESP